jgi:hypothetical protein
MSGPWLFGNPETKTRKSTDEGLEQEFNSLRAQSETCETYVASSARRAGR